jgi:hypothetical protein
VRNDDPSGRHSYRVTVTFGSSGVEQTVPVPNVEAGQTVMATVTAQGPADVTDPTVPCEITRLVDEHDRTPTMGPEIPPPPDTPPPDQPQPTTPPATPTPEPTPPPVPTEPPITPPTVQGS